MPVTKTKTRWIDGALAFYDSSAHYNRILDIIGGNAYKLVSQFEDPVIAAGTLYGWTNTAVEVGTGSSTVIAQTDVDGGAIRLNSAANENDGLQLQSDGAFTLGSADKLYFGCRWNISENTQSDAFIGLAVTDTTILAGNPDDMVGFIKADASANLNYIVRKNATGAAVDTGVDLVNDTFVITEFYYDGTTIYLYVNGSEVAAVTSNIPNDVQLRISLCYLNGAGSSQNEGIEVNWVRTFEVEG